ncbi:MAG: hypothetical protein JKY19_05565 [Alcanivoracaceae bacterium]|nr:hypothetical protein [Alcanivoracaceae bacterium]
MKKMIMLIIMVVFMASCASTQSYDSATPMRDKYGKISVSPTAKKSLRGELADEPENEVFCNKVTKTGTRIPTITCKTIAEHKNHVKRSKLAADAMIKNTNRNMGKVNN